MKHKMTKGACNREARSAETGLTAIQEKCAILLASGVSIDDVCKAQRISRVTLYRWRRMIVFQCYYNQAKQDAKDYIESSLMNLHDQAIQAIEDSINSNNEAIKLKASMWILDRIASVDVGETDVRAIVRQTAKEKSSMMKYDELENARHYDEELKANGLCE